MAKPAEDKEAPEAEILLAIALLLASFICSALLMLPAQQKML